MGDIGENYDPPVWPIYDAGTRAPRNQPRQSSPGLTPRETALRRAIARNEAELARLEAERERRAERFGEEPPVGSVITFTKLFSDPAKPYSYAALRTGPERVSGGGWYITGRDGKQPRDWDALCEFIGDNPFRVIPPSGVAGHQVDGGPFVVMVDEAAAILGAVKDGWREAEPKSATERALAKLHPFIVGREPNGGRWQVIDERLQLQVDAITQKPLDIIKTYPANDKGRARAHQSVRDRNKAYRDQVRQLEVEPPVGSRVSSVEDARRWAHRKPDGWTRYNGSHIQGVRLGWESVLRQLGEIRPGVGRSYEMIN